MRYKLILGVAAVIIGVLIFSSSPTADFDDIPGIPEDSPSEILEEEATEIQGQAQDRSHEFINYLVEKYKNHKPINWGEMVPGVVTAIDTEDKIIALTLDACGGRIGSGYDKELIDYLNAEGIPATLFISGEWIKNNSNIMEELTQNPLFQIENHGYQHKPLSVEGNTAYGIASTASIDEVINEILSNEELIMGYTGGRTQYFRSGTAYYDEIAVLIAEELGYRVINYNILGDAGGSFNKKQVTNAILSSKPGSIVLLHMNRPASDISAGVKAAIPQLRERGYSFVLLRDYDDFLK